VRPGPLLLIGLIVLGPPLACSGGSNDGGDDTVLTVRQALAAAPAEVTVQGLVIETGGEVLLAEALAESYPPQPGGAVLVLDGVRAGELDGATTEGDTTWLDRPQRVSGTIEGEVLSVATIAPAD
jgi:hypothetical protein